MEVSILLAFELIFVDGELGFESNFCSLVARERFIGRLHTITWPTGGLKNMTLKNCEIALQKIKWSALLVATYFSFCIAKRKDKFCIVYADIKARNVPG